MADAGLLILQRSPCLEPDLRLDPEPTHGLGPGALQVTIRSATVDDAAAARDVVCRSITHGCVADHRGDPVLISRWLANKTVENMRKWIGAEGATAVLAQRAGAIVGFALLAGDELALCYVVPEALHQGVGKALLQEACMRARARGHAVLRLESTRTAVAFYRRAGCVEAESSRRWAGLETQPLCLPLAASGDCP